MPLVWCVLAEPASVGVVRRRLRAHLAGLAQDHVENVLLAASELVTNAILHGEGSVAVTVWVSRLGVRMEVADNGAATPQLGRDDNEEQASGRGLLIVDALATHWGVTPKSRGPGKTVWFEMGELSH